MPTFTIHEDQNEFMTTWDDTKAQYALIRANNIQFLVPFLDINLIKKTDLTKLIHEYDDQVFTLFNKLSGLPTNMDLDPPILGRYFVKADAHVVGAAYYGHLWTSQNGHSIKDYLTINWLPIHEIGHGYEIPNDGMNIVDVFNNVYCTIYQENYLTDFIKNSWLFRENKDKVVNELYTKLVNDHLTYNQINSYGLRLLMLMNLVDFKGKSGFTKFNEYHRQLTNAGYHKLARDFGSVCTIMFANEYGINIIPYLNITGIHIDAIVAANILNAHKQTAAMVGQVVPDDQINDVLQKLGWDTEDIKSKLSLITNDQLALLGLKINIYFTY